MERVEAPPRRVSAPAACFAQFAHKPSLYNSFFGTAGGSAKVRGRGVVQLAQVLLLLQQQNPKLAAPGGGARAKLPAAAPLTVVAPEWNAS